MKNRHILIICLLLLTSIGRSQVRAWQDPPPRRALDPNLFVIRLLLGVGDDASSILEWRGQARSGRGCRPGRLEIPEGRRADGPALLAGSEPPDPPG